ncbi:MAG: HNH endonuclease [Nitrospira sp.]|nr:HNH endonuclease [Nitrospira sp.]
MVCEFDFDKFYGPDLSIGYIEVHHLIPMASLTKEIETDIKNLIVVCSNCHRMIHRKKGEVLDWKFLRREVSRRRKIPIV